MLKIHSGEFRSRILKSPSDNKTTRPYTARSREMVFNHLRGHIKDSTVLDLFAGCGTIGLEAISRGAKQALMVEKNKSIYSLLVENISLLNADDRAISINCDALSEIPLIMSLKPIDIVFLDPPYQMMLEEKMRNRIMIHMSSISQYMSNDGYIVLRTPTLKNFKFHVPSLKGPESHQLGPSMQIHFFIPS